jgi:hypothetical protein
MPCIGSNIPGDDFETHTPAYLRRRWVFEARVPDSCTNNSPSRAATNEPTPDRRSRHRTPRPARLPITRNFFHFF